MDENANDERYTADVLNEAKHKLEYMLRRVQSAIEDERWRGGLFWALNRKEYDKFQEEYPEIIKMVILGAESTKQQTEANKIEAAPNADALEL